MYAAGTDMSALPYTDTMQPNPLYRGSSGGRGLIDIDSGAYRNPQFTQTMNTPWGQMDPNQFYRQRDAFIQTANDQAGRYMGGAGTSGAPGATPQFSPNDMWRQAGNMVDQGWQNPYQNVPIPSTFRPGMAQPTQSQSQGTPYGAAGGMPRGDMFVGRSASGTAPYGPPQGWQTGRMPQAMPRNPAPAPKNQFTGPWTGGPIASPGRVMGGNRPSGPAQSWGQQHAANIASPANRSWLRGMTPANRQVYGMMQKMY